MTEGGICEIAWKQLGWKDCHVEELSCVDLQTGLLRQVWSRDWSGHEQDGDTQRLSPFLLGDVDLSLQSHFLLAAGIFLYSQTPIALVGGPPLEGPAPRVQARLLCWHFTEAILPSLFAVGHRSPPARSGHRCVADNANLYVFGGYNPDYDESGGPENEDYPLFRELWRYNFATDTWHQMGTEGYMPRELASMSRTYRNSIPMSLLLELF